MNYRHIYHAGNFADVLKHAVLTRLIRYQQNKDKAFRLLDTHAGIGLYDLSSEEAQRTGEWRDGIGRLLEANLEPQLASLLEPYLSAVRTLNPDGGVAFIPVRQSSRACYFARRIGCRPWNSIRRTMPGCIGSSKAIIMSA